MTKARRHGMGSRLARSACTVSLAALVTLLAACGDKEPPPGPADGAQTFTYTPSQLAPIDPAKIVLDREESVELIRDQIVVTLRPGVAEEAFARTLAGLGAEARIVGRIPSLGMLEIEVPAARRRELRDRLATAPHVAAAGFNRMLSLHRTFDDPALVNQNRLDDWGLRRIDAPAAWDITTGMGAVAIVDSGCLVGHEELAGAIRDPWSMHTDSPQMQTGEVETKNGKTFITGHGTHVACTAAGTAGNGRGTVGVAPDCSVIPIQVLGWIEAKGSITCSDTQAVDGLARAIGSGARVLNYSVGVNYAPGLIRAYRNGTPQQRREIEDRLRPSAERGLENYKAVLDQAHRSRVIFVKSAGNNSMPAFLDAICLSERALGVAATTPSDERASFSNFGVIEGGRVRYATVSAPGEKIWNAWSDPQKPYTDLQGTSMAAPHVAGLVALMKSVAPDLSFEEVRDILVSTGERLATDHPIGPLVNARAALEEVQRRRTAGVPPPPALPPLLPVPPGGTPGQPPPTPPGDQPTPPGDQPTPPGEQPTPPGEQPSPPDDPPTPPGDQPVPPRPPTADELDPDAPEIAALIREWISIAAPPPNATDGASLRYNEWGVMLGRTRTGTITGTPGKPDDVGGRSSPAYLWSLRTKLDSVDHGTLEEYVMARLAGRSLDSFRGRYKPPPLSTVPDLGGQTRADAERRLREAGFDVRFAEGAPAPSPEAVGRVESQSLRAGERLRWDKRITLKVHGEYTPPEADAYYLVCLSYVPQRIKDDRPDGVKLAEHLKSLNVDNVKLVANDSPIVFHVMRPATPTYAPSVFVAGYRFAVPIEIVMKGEDGQTVNTKGALLMEVKGRAADFAGAVRLAPKIEKKGEDGVLRISEPDGSFRKDPKEDQPIGLRGAAPVAGWSRAHIALSIELVKTIAAHLKCFVVTAAYGVPDNRPLQVLRRFRDQVLLRTGAGRRLVNRYYRHGPAWARTVRRVPGLDAGLRGIFDVLTRGLERLDFEAPATRGALDTLVEGLDAVVGLLAAERDPHDVLPRVEPYPSGETSGR